jgi:hypothetical protein
MTPAASTWIESAAINTSGLVPVARNRAVTEIDVAAIAQISWAIVGGAHIEELSVSMPVSEDSVHGCVGAAARQRCTRLVPKHV